MWEAIAIIVALPIAWFLFKLITAYLLPPEKTGRRLLRMEARKLGVDVSAIPDAAWDELVGRCIAVAKLTSPLDKQSTNWRANLVSYLEAEASFVASVLNGWSGAELEGTRETLKRHGVNLPPPLRER